ncbi:hypothetical protein BJ875DRAFT_281622 [Amylocarpus encephaloides]|uniref:Uncharacterized protein n=1 Tax=Amylocarpus encephaloides TaxID=45428 RepID=A0A9P7YK74_9HELO|nr:hypothetical protein BJ875DRAFT_281622 [Amylocarpus encephaloides]
MQVPVRPRTCCRGRSVSLRSSCFFQRQLCPLNPQCPSWFIFSVGSYIVLYTARRVSRDTNSFIERYEKSGCNARGTTRNHSGFSSRMIGQQTIMIWHETCRFPPALEMPHIVLVSNGIKPNLLELIILRAAITGCSDCVCPQHCTRCASPSTWEWR